MSGAEAGEELEHKGPQAWGRRGMKQGLIINVGVRAVEFFSHTNQEECGGEYFNTLG